MKEHDENTMIQHCTKCTMDL